MCTMYLATILRNVSIKVIYKYVYELDISYAYALIAMWFCPYIFLWQCELFFKVNGVTIMLRVIHLKSMQ